MKGDEMLRLLGPVEIWGESRRLATGSPRQRLVLAALAVDAGRTVSVDVLVDRIWGADPPPQARRTVHSYIARARRTLEQMRAGAAGPVRVLYGGGGYRLEIDLDRVDLHRFRRLVGQARTSFGVEQRGTALREALALWRGDPLIGLDGQWAERIRQSWQHERVSAVVAWAETELAVGGPADVLGAVVDLAAEFPLDESLTGVRMRLLAAVGRKAEALECYTEIRAAFADELGIDLGPELQAVHRSLLRGELDPKPRPAAWPLWATEPAPAQLPPDLTAFAGREDQLETLAALAASTRSAAGGSAVAVLSGPAGAGKTALAVHAGHRIAELFPDGQLYLDLRGTGRPLDAAVAVRHLLDGLNVPADRVPSEPDARFALYRSRTSGRRLLIVLDNAATDDQLRPLLPGSPGCLVIVTTRAPIVGLVAACGALPVAVDRLSPAEARQLLTRRLGATRVAAEPEAIAALVERCAGLPAALATVAAQAAIQPQLRLTTLAGTLVNQWRNQRPPSVSVKHL